MTEPQEPLSATPRHPAPEELSVYAFSPQEAAAGVGEHMEGCAACAAEVEDLRLVLAGLARLPEPELPVEVGVRLDAAIARAWQEADAERAATEAAAAAPGRRRLSWRRFALPTGALCLLALGGVGVGLALNQGGEASPSAASGAAAQGSGDVALNEWVHSVLPGPGTQAPEAATPHVQNGSKVPHITQGPLATGGTATTCASYPQLAGYRILETAQREFEGKQATLVVYQNDEGPASATVYAVVYAGPCPNASSEVLDQGSVSR